MKRVFVHMSSGKTLKFRAEEVEVRTGLGRIQGFTLTNADARFGTFLHIDLNNVIAITYRVERWWEGLFA
jgi:hypothetical protein